MIEWTFSRQFRQNMREKGITDLYSMFNDFLYSPSLILFSSRILYPFDTTFTLINKLNPTPNQIIIEKIHNLKTQMSSGEQDQIPTQQQNQQPKVVPSPTKQTPSSIPQAKKTASYTYWVDEKNKSRELPPEQRPKKIEAPLVANQQQEGGRSQWNTAGTWENKKISVSDVEKQYTEKLGEWLATACPQAKISKVSLNGQCEVVFSRNKKSLTYEITGKVEFQKTLQPPKEQQTEVQKQKPQKPESNQGDSSNSDDKESPKGKKKSKSSAKSNKFSIEITDLTDSGDRDHSVKADTAEDKKWIAGQSNKVLTILEDILKSYK